MEEITLTSEPVEEVVLETVTEPQPLKRTKKAAKKTNRSISELHNTPPKRMTESEKVEYILALRELYVNADCKAARLEENCKSAYEKCRQLDQKFAEYKNIARAKLQFARQAISTCNNSIILAGNIEED